MEEVIKISEEGLKIQAICWSVGMSAGSLLENTWRYNNEILGVIEFQDIKDGSNIEEKLAKKITGNKEGTIKRLIWLYELYFIKL